ADSGPGDDPERGRPAEQRPVDPGIGAGDRALGDGESVLAGRADEPTVPVEHAGDQARVDGTQRHHHRQVTDLLTAGHQACPNVAPGTGATLCQAPSPAEAAVAAMTSPS